MMDEFSSSFFDYPSTTPSTVSSVLDINGSGLDSTVKQESFESSVWIQGFPDIGGGNTVNDNHSFEPIKNSFIDSLMSEPMLSHTPSPIEDSIDPLDIIFSEPLPNIQQPTVQSNLQNNAKPHSDLELLNALDAASSQSATTSSADIISSDSLLSANSTVEVKQEAEIDAVGSNENNVEEKDAENEKPREEEIDPEKDLNLQISNVVTSFRVRCHLNLRMIAQEGINVIYQKESKKIIMRVRRPSCTAYIWSSGKVICTGASSETNARKASRKFARRLQKIGFKVIFSNYKVINVLAVCKMPYHINIVEFSQYYKSKYLSYEPEIHPAVTYRMPEFKVTFKIFSTGSITLTCPVVARIPEAIKKVYPMVKGFFKLDKPNLLATTPSDLSDVESDGNNIEGASFKS